MKKAVIALVLLSGLLATLLVKTRNGTTAQVEELTKEIQSLSNKVTEAQTRLVMNQALSNDKFSNLETNLTLRLKELATASNQLKQAKQSIATEQQATAKALGEAQHLNTRIGELENDLADAKRRLEPIPNLESQIKTLTSSLSVLSAERDALSHELRQVRLAEADALRKLQDLGYLRLLVVQLQDEARLARQLSAKGPKPSLTRKSQIELLPDGTVRLKPPTNSVATSSAAK